MARMAEVTNVPRLRELKRKMEFLERKVSHYRHCLYTGQAIEEKIESSELPDRRPKPEWE